MFSFCCWWKYAQKRIFNHSFVKEHTICAVVAHSLCGCQNIPFQAWNTFCNACKWQNSKVKFNYTTLPTCRIALSISNSLRFCLHCLKYVFPLPKRCLLFPTLLRVKLSKLATCITFLVCGFVRKSMVCCKLF